MFRRYFENVPSIATNEKPLFYLIPKEILPLVEFVPEDGLAENEVERLLMAPPRSNEASFDPFVDTMINEEISDMLPLTLDRDALRALDPTTILIAKWPKPLKTKYYRNLMPEWQISMCSVCLQVDVIFMANHIFSIRSVILIFFSLSILFHRVGIPHRRLRNASAAKRPLSILSYRRRSAVDIKSISVNR